MTAQKQKMRTGLFALALVALPGAIGWRTPLAAVAEGKPAPDPARVERGAHLVRTMGCNDCHTPWKMGPRGPEPDMSRALTGHPSDLVMPPPPKLPEGPSQMPPLGTVVRDQAAVDAVARWIGGPAVAYASAGEGK